jgi:hypothetical protein
MRVMDTLEIDEGTVLSRYRFHNGKAELKALSTIAIACNNCGLIRQFLEEFLLRKPGSADE